MKFIIFAITILFAFQAFAENHKYSVRVKNVKNSRDKDVVVATIKEIEGVKIVDFKRSGEIIVCVSETLELTADLLKEKLEPTGFGFRKVVGKGLC